MDEQPMLSEAEWDLVVELLERERGELPTEIRHTRLANLREELRRREAMVGDLLARLGKPAEG